MPKLTDLTLRNLPIPPIGQITYDDEGSPLRIRVSQGGSKTFVVNLGRGRRHTIGRYGEVSLSDAREAARRLRAEKTLGRILPASVSFATAREEYLAQIDVRRATREYYVRHLGRLRGTKLADNTPREINRVLDALPPAARVQALRTYTAFFNWCIRRHYLDTSPCARMQVGKSTKRARVLSDEELQRIWRVCDQIPPTENPVSDANHLPAHFATIVELLILTGQRRGEIAALRPEYFSHNQQTLRLPSELTKNRREHTFPIGPCSAAILFEAMRKSAPTIDTNSSEMTVTSAFLFPARGQKAKPFNGWSKSMKAFRKRLGPDFKHFTLHDLRRTYRTILGQIGIAPHIAERLVNHISATSEIEKTYDLWTYMPDMREAARKFDIHIRTVLGIT